MVIDQQLQVAKLALWENLKEIKFSKTVGRLRISTDQKNVVKAVKTFLSMIQAYDFSPQDKTELNSLLPVTFYNKSLDFYVFRSTSLGLECVLIEDIANGFDIDLAAKYFQVLPFLFDVMFKESIIQSSEMFYDETQNFVKNYHGDNYLKNNFANVGEAKEWVLGNTPLLIDMEDENKKEKFNPFKNLHARNVCVTAIAEALINRQIGYEKF